MYSPTWVSLTAAFYNLFVNSYLTWVAEIQPQWVLPANSKSQNIFKYKILDSDPLLARR